MKYFSNREKEENKEKEEEKNCVVSTGIWISDLKVKVIILLESGKETFI